MNLTNGNFTLVCPNQQDSILTVVSSWVGIVTFITTTLGGLTIFYTMYKSFQKTQEGILDFSTTVALSSRELISDIETLEPFLRSSSNHHLLRNMLETVARMRRLTNHLDTAIKSHISRNVGFGSIMETYKFGNDKELTNQMNELQRPTNSLQTMRVNMVLVRLDEQSKALQGLKNFIDIDPQSHEAD